MRIDIYHHILPDATVDARLDEILTRLKSIQQIEEAVVTPELQRLQQSVADETTVIQSAVTFIGGLADQIRALKDDPAALATLADQVDAGKQELATAIATPPA